MPGLRFHCDKETEILDDAEMGEFAYGYIGNSVESELIPRSEYNIGHCVNNI